MTRRPGVRCFAAPSPRPERASELLTALMLAPSTTDYEDLAAIFRREGWVLDRVATLRQAIDRARAGGVPIIIVGGDAGDGAWQLLASAVFGIPDAPRIIVFSRLADERLWAEVLNLGGFDLMRTPFEPREVFHVIGHAWRSWNFERRYSGPRRPIHLAPGPVGALRAANRNAI